MINIFKEDNLKQRTNYIGELARSNDLYRQLGQVREEYENHTRDFDEQVVANNQMIDIMLKNSEFFKKRNDDIIEQLLSIFEDKDRNIEELKYEIKNKDISKNKIYEELQKIENNDQKLEKFIEFYDDVVKEGNDKIYNMLNKFKENTKTGISNLHEKAINRMNKFDVKLNELENNIEGKDNYIKKNNKRKLDVANNQYSNLVLEYNKSKSELMEIKDKLNKTKDKLDKEEIEKEIKCKNEEAINLENKLSKKNIYILKI